MSARLFERRVSRGLLGDFLGHTLVFVLADRSMLESYLLMKAPHFSGFRAIFCRFLGGYSGFAHMFSFLAQVYRGNRDFPLAFIILFTYFS